MLPDRGYTAHVLGYTAAALLEAHVKAGVGAGELDACVEPLLPTLEGDLFGEVSVETDVLLGCRVVFDYARSQE